MTAARIVLAFVFLTLLAPAGAQAELIVPDTGARPVFALDDTVVYQRVFGRPGTVSRTRPWMRVVDGRRLRARGVPRGAYGSAIGRDYKGRVVLTMATSRSSGIQWWVYYVRQDRARRLTSLRGPCVAGAVSIWRHRVAYTVNRCARRDALGVFLRTGRRVRHLAGFAPRRDLYDWYLPVLRGGALLALSGNGDGDGTLWRMTDRGRVCRAPIPGADTTEYGFLGAWIEGRTLLWWLIEGAATRRDTGGLVGVALGGTCERPGPTGPVPLAEGPTRVLHRDISGNSLYYAETDGIHRVTRPSRPVTAPPPNDDFANAEPLPATVPSSREVTIGNATTEPGEPSLGSGTMWYSFRPTTSQRLEVFYLLNLGVFTGSSVGSLQPVGTQENVHSGITRFDAQAGQTYYIGVGCPFLRSDDYEFTCDLPYELAIRPG